MSDKLTQYRQGNGPLPRRNRMWPLYGAGFENLGLQGEPIETSMLEIGPGELLIRHDACGLCFSDIKVIKAGESHPRIRRNMKSNPVVLGHEISATVVQVGENLQNQYHVGDRFIIQADIYNSGINNAYGYEIQGGLSLYNVIDSRVLNGDHGNYLIPVQPLTGYAESALTEPWACVIAAYELKYRTGLKPGGTTWIIGVDPQDLKEYTISAGFDQASHPARLLLSNVPAHFAGWLKDKARALGIEVFEDVQSANLPVARVDDIVLLESDPDIIEAASSYLAVNGVFALITDQSLPRNVQVDVGRIHYDDLVYVGGTGPDIARAYDSTPVRSTLKPGGKAWFVGAGGPMGRMHVQRAIQVAGGPTTILCTDVSDLRLDDLCVSYAAEAKAKGIEFICLNPTHQEEYQAKMDSFLPDGFDDIIILAPIPAVITEAADYLAQGGVLNIFAGLNRGTMAPLNLSDVVQKNTRTIGHSASSIDDLKLMLSQAEGGVLSPNRSVAAIGSLSAARDGYKAVLDTSFPGKVVIYPQIKEFPLTPLSDLQESLPSVYARLKNGREWTVEAEDEFLRLMLP